MNDIDVMVQGKVNEIRKQYEGLLARLMGETVPVPVLIDDEVGARVVIVNVPHMDNLSFEFLLMQLNRFKPAIVWKPTSLPLADLHTSEHMPKRAEEGSEP